MTSKDLKHLHPDDVTLWLAVETACWRLAIAAKAPVKSVIPVSRSHTGRVAGYYFHPPSDQLQVSLRIWERGQWRKTRRQSLHELLDTIAHEMAHSTAGEPGHGPKFFREFARMILLQEKLNLRLILEQAGAKLPA